MTTSGTSKTLFKVSLVVLFRMRRAGENTKMGGLLLKILKKLKGLKLGSPLRFTVEANAMGRGATIP
jgi:hypothetical protein